MDLYCCPSCRFEQLLEFDKESIARVCEKCSCSVYQYIDLAKPATPQVMDLTLDEQGVNWGGYRKPFTYIGILLGAVAIVSLGVVALNSGNEIVPTPIVQAENDHGQSKPIISASAPEISQTSDSVLVSFELHSDSEAPYPAINILACLENPCNGKVAKTWTFASNAYPHAGEKLIKQTIQLQVPLRNIPSTTQSIAVEVVDSPANLKGQNN